MAEAGEPRLKQYGIVRLLRDVLCVSGFVEVDGCSAEMGVVLNRSSPPARLLVGGRPHARRHRTARR